MKILGRLTVTIGLVFGWLVLFPAASHAYPKNEVECGIAGGAWVSSGSKGFCYTKLAGPQASKDCTDSGAIIVKDGPNNICSTRDPDIKASCQKLLEETSPIGVQKEVKRQSPGPVPPSASLRGNTIKVVWTEGKK